MTVAKNVVCTSCGYVGIGRIMGCLQVGIVIFLSLFGLIPGILYAMYADSYNKRCPKCDNKSLVPADSPNGQQILKNRRRATTGAALLLCAILFAPASRAAQYPLVICLGDAVTLGNDLPSYPQQMQALMPNALIVDYGAGGVEIVTSGEFRLRRMLASLPAGQHPIVVVMYGIYDARLPDPVVEIPTLDGTVYQGSLERIVTLIRNAGGVPVLLTPTPMGPNYSDANAGLYMTNGVNFELDKYADRVRAVAASTGAQLIDMNLACKNEPGWMDGLVNGINPSPAQAGFIASTVFNGIKTIPLPSGSGGVKGDVTGDGAVTVADLFALINYLFTGVALP